MFINNLRGWKQGVLASRLGSVFRTVVLASSSVFAFMLGTESVADPMRPPGYGAVSTTKAYRSTSYSLSQILISDERKRAVINETLVSEGSKVDGAKVLKIENNKVILRVDGKSKVLLMSDAKGFQIKRETE